MRREKTERKSLAESFHFPQDVASGETLLEFTGKSSVRIENYRSILVYTDTQIRIQAKKYQLCIIGKNLCIRYYDKDEMVVTGRMESVSFE